jgi:dTDP-4-amino-4,6-dideoxygalactose transaminase
MIPLVDVKAQNDELRNEIGKAVGAVVQSGAFILGPQVEEFEEAFARFVGVKHAIGVACGLDALTMTLRALEISWGDDVLVPTNSFVASAQAIMRTGARPVFVDCDPATYLMDLTDAEAAVTPSTKAIMPVHLYGQCCDMTAVAEFAMKHKLVVIEDACQAHGATRYGAKAGSFGNAGCFSFYPAKNLGAFGDGGMVVTGDGSLAERVRRYRNYGQAAKYEHVEFGVNSRLDTIQAAVLNCKLTRLDHWNEMRRVWAVPYQNFLSEHPRVTTPCTVPGNTHVWHLYVARIEGMTPPERAEVIRKARERGVSLGIHYPTPIHQQLPFVPIHAMAKDRILPAAEHAAESIVSLPMHPHLTKQDVSHVVEVLLDLI